MNILDTIIVKKREEIAEGKQNKPVKDLEKLPLFQRTPLSLKDALLDKKKTGIITEFKRRSPSKGIINNTSSVREVTAAYTQYGASALSVLTDESFFGGSLPDLLEARGNNIPLLRKDFIVDEYQLIESKAFGADIILLIAACLSIDEVKHLGKFARNLGLSVLLEIHNHSELDHISEDVDVVGVNNRNLKDFKVDLKHSVDLGNSIPEGKIKIAESGIHDPTTVDMLRKHGFKGFLIGEKFMKEKDPGEAFKSFVQFL